jgi:hypothetical protein
MFISPRQQVPISLATHHHHYHHRHLFARRVPLALVTVMLLLLSGSAWAQTSHSSRPTPIPNSKRYRDKGLHPATGRSGSASLTVRALIDKAGNTDIEMTTGLLDSDQTPPGNINKAQLKPLNQDGKALYTRNYNGLTGGGYFTTRVNDLHHLQQVQAQTNINGIDSRRTNVVTVVETVKKRPDLALSHLSPAAGLLGTPVNISVLASELNGDVGASANCILYINGIAADQATGIYVDANDAVTVAFTHVFTSPGTYQIKVGLGNIRPGDYDASNNEITGSLVITQPNDTLNYSASFSDEESSTASKFDHKLQYNDPQSGYLDTYGFETSTASATQQAYLSGSAPHYSSFPYDVAVGETGASGSSLSSTISGIASTGSFNFDFGPFTYEFANGFGADPTQNVRVYLSNFKISDGTGILFGGTSITYERFAGTVTYHSSNYAKYWYKQDGVQHDLYDYTVNEDTTTSNGQRLTVGAQHSIVLALSSADEQIFTASPVMDIVATSFSFITPGSGCTTWRYPDPPEAIYYSGSDCEQLTFTGTRKTGSASFDGAP